MAIIKIKDKNNNWQEITTINGKDGADGKDGYTPIKGVDYFDGKDGVDGINGQGVPTGGTSGQFLSKLSDNDYDTAWKDIDLENVVHTDGDETIEGTKTFSSLPISSVVPTEDNQLTNKKYIDDIVNGLGSGSESSTVEYVAGTTNSNPFILEGKKKGIYIFDGNAGVTIYLRARESNTTSLSTYNYLGNMLYLMEEINDDTPNDTRVAMYVSADLSMIYTIMTANPTNVTSGLQTGSRTYSGGGIVRLNSSQTISGVKTFSKLPTSSVAPTSNTQFTNKAYVDGKSITSIALTKDSTGNITGGNAVLGDGSTVSITITEETTE